MPKIALIVIDVQNCFTNDSTSHLAERIKKHIEKNRKGYDEIVFTIFRNEPGSNFARNGYSIGMGESERMIPEPLDETAKRYPVFTKSTFSAFKAPGLMEYLKNSGIREVRLCGTDTEACVSASAYEAFDLGFDVKILAGLCASCNGKKFHEHGLQILQKSLGFNNGKKAERC